MNRRYALGMLAATAGAMLGAPALGQQAQAPAQPKIVRKGRIKQGLWRVNFGANTQLTFDDMCREAARLGVYGFDLIDPADWPTLRKHGLEPLARRCGPGHVSKRHHSPRGARSAREGSQGAHRHDAPARA